MIRQFFGTVSSIINDKYIILFILTKFSAKLVKFKEAIQDLSILKAYISHYILNMLTAGHGADVKSSVI